MRGRFSQTAVAWLYVATAAGVMAAEHRVAFESRADSLLIRLDDWPWEAHPCRARRSLMNGLDALE